MKLAESWRTRGIFSVKFLGIFLGALMLVGFLMPRVWAAEGQGEVKTVSPGAGTLKAAVAAANDGDVLKLKAGSYTGNWNDGREVKIDKTLTIEGAGVGQTTIDVPIEITATDKEVVLKDFGSSTIDVERNFVYVAVNEKTKLTIENVSIWGILRGDKGVYPIHDATGISIKPEAAESDITLNNVKLVKPGVHYGILNKASDTKITLDNNTEIEGRATIHFEDGSNNTLDIKGGSSVEGPSSLYTDNKSIVVIKQTGLRINLDNGKIAATMPKGNGETKVLSIDANSTNTKIDLRNNSTISYQARDGKTDIASKIFDFDPAVTAEKQNEITMDNTSKVYRSVQGNHYNELRQEDVEVEHEYSKLNGGAVVGVFDKDGGRTIKVYDDGAEISDLVNKNYDNKSKEGYNFKGWFKDFDGTNYSNEYAKLEDGSYDKAKTGVNMDLYPKFLKRVKVTIGEDESIELEEGQTLADVQGVDIDSKLEALKKDDLNFKGYVVHGETGGEISFTTEKISELKQRPITEDVKIEAIHDVTITVNDTQFTLEVGQTVADIADQGAYNEARLDGEDEKHFSRLVYQGEDRTFEKNTPINNNIEVETKHYRTVKIEGGDTEYLVEEGKKISEDKEGALIEALMAIQEAPVENKTFGRFEDSANSNAKVDLTDYVINNHAAIKPVYTVNVKIGDNNYTLDEGTSLGAHSDKSQIEKDLKKLVEGVKTAEQQFKGFVLASGGEEEELEASELEADDKIAEILGRTITGNTDIFAKFNAKITIKCPESACGAEQKEFEVATGSKLSDLLKTEQKADYEKAKYQKYESDAGNRDERFGGFVVEGTDELFTEEQVVEKSLTLTPKYYVFVTVVDERPNVGGKYKVETGKDLDEMVPLNGSVADTSEVLATLRSDITPDLDAENNPGAEDLHFDRLLVKSGTKDLLNETITDDVEIAALYHYDVIVVKDYDEPNTDLSAVDPGVYGFKVYRGEGLGSADKLSEVQEALESLIKTANKLELGRKFYRFYDEKMGVTYDEGALKDKAFNRHLYVTAKVEYKVAVEGDGSEYYVVEGETIGSSEALKGAMKALEEVSDKKFNGYKLNEQPIEEAELLATKVENGTNKIDAQYKVVVKIGNESFEIEEGGNLNSLEETDKQRAKNALKALEEEITGKEQNFDGYSVAGTLDEAMKHPFSVNTEVVAKSAIEVTIDGKKVEVDPALQTGDVLSDKVDLTSYKNDRGDGAKFARFADDKGQTFDENAPLAKNETLTTKYAFVVTIDGDDSYRSEEGTALNSDAKIAGKLAELKTAKPEKTFGRFEDEDGNEITEDQILEKNTTIKPVYQVKITIGDSSYMIDEGETLNDLADGGELTSQLNSLEKTVDKKFNKYYVNGHELDHEELMEMAFNDNAAVEVKYNVVVTVGGKWVLLPEGTKYANATELIGLIINLEVPEGKARVAYVTYDGTSQLDDDYSFDKNTKLTPKYYVTLEFEGIDGKAELLEGEPVRNATELVAKLSDSKRDFKEFNDGSNLDTTIVKNTKLTPSYTVNVTIQDHKGNSDVYKVDEGTTLQDLIDGEYDEPDSFIRFVDLNGNEIQLSDELHEHKTVVPIYGITVTLPDGTAKPLESGQSLGDLDANVLNNLKSDDDGRRFSRFVKKGTKEMVPEDEPLYESLAIEPKFLNNISVAAQDDEGNPVENSKDLNLELEEGLPLTELSEGQKGNLNQWLRDNMVALAESGKPDYAFSHYVDENGKTIDGSELKNNDKIMAVFTYQPQAAFPEVPADTADESAKSPDTGYNDGDEATSYSVAIISGLTVLAGASVVTIYGIKLRKRE